MRSIDHTLKAGPQASDERSLCAVCLALALGAAPLPATADDTADLSDAAQAFVTAKEAGNRDLLKYVVREEDYEDVVEELDREQPPVRENLDIDAVRVTEQSGDRATAEVEYSPKHSGEVLRQKVELRKVDGEWRVALPETPAAQQQEPREAVLDALKREATTP
jgi:hypothetical protein